MFKAWGFALEPDPPQLSPWRVLETPFSTHGSGWVHAWLDNSMLVAFLAKSNFLDGIFLQPCNKSFKKRFCLFIVSQKNVCFTWHKLRRLIDYLWDLEYTEIKRHSYKSLQERKGSWELHNTTVRTLWGEQFPASPPTATGALLPHRGFYF